VRSWAYRWTYTIWAEGGLCVYPEVNLVSNLGFGDGATNTFQPDKLKGKRPARGLTLLIHPSTVMRRRDADLWTFEHLYWGDPVSRTLRRVEKLGRLAGALFTRRRVRTGSSPAGAVGPFRTIQD